MSISIDTVYIANEITTTSPSNYSWEHYFSQPDTYIAIIAIFISLIAIRYARKTINLTHKHNILSTKPILTCSSMFFDDLIIKLENNGFGPAIIKKMVLKYKDIESDTIINLLDKCVEKKYKLPYVILDYKQTSVGDYCLASNSDILLLQATFEENERTNVEEFMKLFESITIEVLYTNIYDEEDTHTQTLHRKTSNNE